MTYGCSRNGLSTNITSPDPAQPGTEVPRLRSFGSAANSSRPSSISEEFHPLGSPEMGIGLGKNQRDGSSCHEWPPAAGEFVGLFGPRLSGRTGFRFPTRA